MMVPKKVSAATEEVAVEAIEETTTESTIRMRRASKLLSKMKLIIITTIQRDKTTAGDSAAGEAAREVAKVETTTLTEVAVVATEVRVAPGLPRSTKMLERSERSTSSTLLAKKQALRALMPPQLHSESKPLLSAE